MAGAKLIADRFAALSLLPRQCRFAEVGVGYGDFSEQVLKVVEPSVFDAFDLFQWHQIPTIWGRPSGETFKGRTHKEYYAHRFERFIASGVMSLFEGDSSASLARRPDAYYDVIYIDGDHSLDGVWRDADVAIRKLKRDGRLVFNDYAMADYTANHAYGVVQVVNFLCVQMGWTIEYLALDPQLFCDVCIRRVPGLA